MRVDPQLLQGRLAAFVRQRADAKTLARMIDCDVRTAENIRRGHWPNARHWLGLIAAFGADVTDAVFHPDQAAARLEAEVRALEQQLEERKAALRETAGPAARASEAVAPVLDRAAVGTSRALAAPAAGSVVIDVFAGAGGRMQGPNQVSQAPTVVGGDAISVSRQSGGRRIEP